ncbi:Fc.00g027020.m01.CDS01 [Cosmosporella sp. VM-42]
MKSLLFLSVFTGSALAQATAYAQCGGNNWTGETTCVAGYTCKSWNEWYSQCIVGDASNDSPTTAVKTTAAVPTTLKTTAVVPATTLKTSTRTSTTTLKTSTTTKATSTTKAATAVPSSTKAASSGGLKWLGIDESGAEFGQSSYPGVWGTHFIFPDETTIGTLISEGYNMFRVPFLMERMAVDSLTSTLAPAYLANLTATVNYITSNGAWAVLDPHNYGRYKGSVITDTAAFGTFWKNLATAFKSNEKVVFDTNNEYHDMDQSLVLNLNQAAINSIRAAGATSQYIFVEGNSWSGAWHWSSTNDNLADLTDPQNKIVYEMHQYLDSDGSGTSETCVSSTIGAERMASATEWLKENGKLGVLGEFAGGANDICNQAVTGLLDHLEANSDVWLGAVWWAAGPWWDQYMYSFEPPKGKAYVYYDSLLQSYLP